MAVIGDIIASLKEDAPITEVRIGPFWTGVKSKNLGMASSMFVHEHRLGAPVPDAGKLTTRTAKDLAREVGSGSDLMRCLAIAAANSILEVDLDRCAELNAEAVLMEKGRGKRVAIIGHFPFVEDVRRVASDLWVLEKRPLEGDDPAERAAELVPRADIVAITGTALLNGTMEELLSYCRSDSFVIVLGPTTPISPVWFDYGVDMVSGTVVTDPQAAMRSIAEGAIFRQLLHCVRLLTMVR